MTFGQSLKSYSNNRESFFSERDNSVSPTPQEFKWCRFLTGALFSQLFEMLSYLTLTYVYLCDSLAKGHTSNHQFGSHEESYVKNPLGPLRVNETGRYLRNWWPQATLSLLNNFAEQLCEDTEEDSFVVNGWVGATGASGVDAALVRGQLLSVRLCTLSNTFPTIRNPDWQGKASSQPLIKLSKILETHEECLGSNKNFVCLFTCQNFRKCQIWCLAFRVSESYWQSWGNRKTFMHNVVQKYHRCWNSQWKEQPSSERHKQSDFRQKRQKALLWR